MKSMYRARSLFAVVGAHKLHGRWLSDTFKPRNAVILSKLTRFEYERIRNHDLDDDELKTEVRNVIFKV